MTARIQNAACLGVVCALIAGWAVPVAVPADEPPAPPQSPLAADDALAQFVLAPGLQIELVAYEPEVVDPVAVRFDEDGRLWVVEMRDYPEGPTDGQPPLSRIRVLTDRDGDGRYETARLFADSLLFPTGVQPWKGGVFVTYSGRVAYMKDTDGDGRADLVETWFTGFAEQNPQLRANHPVLAPDGYIYVANGLRGGTIVDARNGGDPLSISGRDFRFDPRGDAFEAVSGNGQFGLTLDDFGNRFVCSNRNPLMHVVLEDRYLAPRPQVAIDRTTHDVAHSGEQSRIYPLSRAWTTSNLHAGQFTAACGVAIYRGDALPEAYRGAAFTCDPTGNLVHCEAMSPAGGTFASRPMHEGFEFLASRDEWFRPVNLAQGPDGALYVVDMYRAVIEHPEWVPEELRHRPDARYGDDRGRIWRIAAKEWDAGERSQVRLSQRDSGELAALLEHPNAWHRETASRLLLERGEQGTDGLVRPIAQRGHTSEARFAALSLLGALHKFTADDVVAALKDEDGRVRRAAIVRTEPWLGRYEPLTRQVAAMASNDDTGVRFQVALSLSTARDPHQAAGPVDHSAELDAIGRIALSDADDEWTRRAVWLAAAGRSDRVLADVLARLAEADRPASAGQREVVKQMAALCGREERPESAQVALRALFALDPHHGVVRIQRSGLIGLAGAVAQRGQSLSQLLESAASAEQHEALQGAFNKAIAAAAKTASDTEPSDEVRIEAVELLSFAGDAADARAVVEQLAGDEPSRAVREAALEAAARNASRESWQILLARFSQEPPSIRRAVLSGALSRSDGADMLLDAIEASRIKPAEIDRLTVDRLRKHGDNAVRSRAIKLLAAAVPADRQKVLDDYRPVLKLEADPRRGREVFARNCAACHRIGDVGTDVAPDISDSRTKTPEQLLADIVQPNRAIDGNYVGYTAVTTDGRVLEGIVASESSTAVTLIAPEGKSITLPRDQIDELRSSGLSLMPEGLERELPPQAMADLIAFIKGWRYLDGLTPLSDDKER